MTALGYEPREVDKKDTYIIHIYVSDRKIVRKLTNYKRDRGEISGIDDKGTEIEIILGTATTVIYRGKQE